MQDAVIDMVRNRAPAADPMDLAEPTDGAAVDVDQRPTPAPTIDVVPSLVDPLAAASSSTPAPLASPDITDQPTSSDVSPVEATAPSAPVDPTPTPAATASTAAPVENSA